MRARKLPSPGGKGPWFQYGDPVGFEYNIYELPIDLLPPSLDGFRIIHLSDLHAVPKWMTAYDDLLDRLNADVPDLVVITGDFVDDIFNPWPAVPIVTRLIKALPSRLGVLGVLGNHDELLTADDFKDAPVRLIDKMRIELGGVELIGLSGPLRENFDSSMLASIPPRTIGVPRVVLSHYPDHIRRTKVLDADVFLCGHTHGGQINLPGRVPLLRHDSLPMKYFLGVHQMGRTCYVANRGFGFSTAPVRIFCPSEVIEIRLKTA